MSMQAFGDLKVTGEMSINGGTYNKITVLGTLKASQVLESRQVRVVGVLNSEDGLDCEDLSLMGEMNVRNVNIRTSASVLGEMKAGSIRAERFDLRGKTVCGGDFECGYLGVRGVVEAAGLLSAETLFIRSKYRSTAGEAGGKSIMVRPARFYRGMVFVAEGIEFDEIDIGNASIRTVRGKNVRIGRGCKIGRVEYTDALECHPSAKIGEAVKI